jgi:hypothetical protein
MVFEYNMFPPCSGRNVHAYGRRIAGTSMACVHDRGPALPNVTVSGAGLDLRFHDIRMG